MHEVVKGIEVKTYQNTREWMNGGAYRADGYNSLASAEVVVDRKELYDSLPYGYLDGIQRSEICDLVATAIESGSIIRLKEKE